MNWVTTIPTESGTYWKKESINGKAVTIQLNPYNIAFFKSEYRSPIEQKVNMIYYALKYNPDELEKWKNKDLDAFTTWWYGPITQPPHEH
jgi:hypothetical protein